jgi:Cytochrome c554 and c-prime
MSMPEDPKERKTRRGDGARDVARRSLGFAAGLSAFLSVGAMIGGAVFSAPIHAQSDNQPQAPRQTPHREYVGDETCAACHQSQAASYHLTAHARTSTRASRDTIRGDFSPGSNTLRTANPDLYFQMEADEKGFTQTGIIRTSPTQGITRTERFDIVVGSGRKGQTYLYWDGNSLYELPVSYWGEQNRWVNSPGYIDGTADFDRPILRRCLECHATTFQSAAPPENAYVKNSLVLGIACEKCHGPGSEHVTRYRSAHPPQSTADAAIVNPAKLSRERRTDVCALCHAGPGDPITPPLSFTPGEVLAEHLVFAPQPEGAHIDVHASQVQLLARSRCFQSSPTMSCSTCHNVHRPERDLAAFATKCLGCHQVESCGQFPKKGRQIADRCVVCHMPLEQTDQIIIAGKTGSDLQPRVRNHQIAIYPDVPLP